MFEGFELRDFDVEGVRIRARIGGDGPPLLLLHGNPQTHAMWHLVTPGLAEDFTVVATDLRGYGDSSKPASHRRPRARTRSERWPETASGVMSHFGFERFAVCGHDRGGRVAYRMALDHPDRVTRLAVLDIVPDRGGVLEGDMAFGLGYWHWFFLAQPYDLPETPARGRPLPAPGRHPRPSTPRPSKSIGACLRDPATIDGICEDYRAAATLDFERDEADRRAGRRLPCPVLVLWGRQGPLEAWYDVLEVWRDWTDDVRGRALDCGHYLPEEAPRRSSWSCKPSSTSSKTKRPPARAETPPERAD